MEFFVKIEPGDVKGGNIFCTRTGSQDTVGLKRMMLHRHGQIKRNEVELDVDFLLVTA